MPARLRARLVAAALVLSSALPMAVAAALYWLPAPPAPVPEGAPAHVLVIGIDGLTLRATRRGITPHIDALAARGAAAEAASALLPGWSAPNWASFLMGAGPARHGITGNHWRPGDWRGQTFCGRPEGAGWPTLFDLLAEQRPGGRGAVFHEWIGIGRLLAPGVAERRLFTVTTARTVRLAARHLRRTAPALTFVHLDLVDSAGHDHGYDSDVYHAAVARADRHVGRLLAALDAAAPREETLVLLLSDHGGLGYSHGGDTPEEIAIPWILAGGTVRPGRLERPISIADSAPTLARAMGLKVPDCWTGRAVTEAFAVLPDG